jgi:hypothetical protein
VELYSWRAAHRSHPMDRHYVIRGETPTGLARMNVFWVNGAGGIAGIANVFGYGGTRISNRDDEVELVGIPVTTKLGVKSSMTSWALSFVSKSLS